MSPITHRWISLVTVVASIVGSGCAAIPDEPESTDLTGAEESVSTGERAVTDAVAVGTTLRATANVNLRTGSSQSYAILHVVPEGSTVTVVAGNPNGGYYQVKHGGTVGWTYGKYYELASAPDNGGDAPPDPGNVPSDLRQEAIARAQATVGFSYWWGHGRFREEGPSASSAGSCSGSCPSCSHSGKYGGDCSGLVAKVWQVPGGNDDLTVDEHPYSTADFVDDTSTWKTVSRASLKSADAMVYRSGSSGHIFLYSKGDAWGSVYAYECKGCATGCVYDLRSATGAYHGIRRAGY